MLYAVIYELNTWRKDYRSLYEKLEDYNSWMHYIKNVWIIDSEKYASEISEDLLPLINKQKDFLIVIELKRNYQGWLPKEAWDWVGQRIF